MIPEGGADIVRIKEGFILRELGGESFAVPVGNLVNRFRGMIRLNETGAFYWKELEKGITRDELVQKMLDRFDGLTEETARKDLNEFLAGIAFAIDEEEESFGEQ